MCFTFWNGKQCIRDGCEVQYKCSAVHARGTVEEERVWKNRDVVVCYYYLFLAGANTVFK